jgi:predicted small metal-binding protein
MPNKDDNNKDNYELSEKQLALVKLATISLGLSNLFTALASETDEVKAKSIIDHIVISMEHIDTIIEEELLEMDLTKTRS